MQKKTSKKDFFRRLTWSGVSEWAGNKILSRGKGYQRGRQVEGLSVTSTGAVVAWVQGEKRYATMVDVEKGKLTSSCTCPYWSTCKHAVAVLLEYLECVKQKTDPPVIEDGDQRLNLLQEIEDDGDDDDEDEEEDEDEDEDEDELDSEGEGDENRLGGERCDKSAVPKRLRSYLDKLSKEEMTTLLGKMARSHPAVLTDLEDQSNLSAGAPKKMVKAIEAEIHSLASEPAWSNYWNGESNVPDYSGVQERMEALLENGYADEVVSLGKVLLREGISQIEMSNDEGETAMEISSCMDVVFRALPRSSLPKVKQMLWVTEAELDDDYELCTGAEAFWKQRHKASDWSKIADILMRRLEDYKSSKEDDTRDYKRDRLSDMIITALENAGRRDEIIPLCEREAVKTKSYLRLVEHLRKARRVEEAEQWICKGMSATKETLPGIANSLRDALREIKEERGDWQSAAALRAEDFFESPASDTFKELEKTSKRAGLWPEVRTGAMDYLETGRITSKWPWSKPTASGRYRRQFPDVETLIDIAMAEKRTEDVIRWYEKLRHHGRVSLLASSKDEEVAKAIADTHPDMAISIWKKLAEGQIAVTQPKAYEVAASHLRKIQRLLKKLDREKECQTYLAALKQNNIRKSRFIEILDGVSGKAIVEG